MSRHRNMPVYSAEMPRDQLGRKRLAVYAQQLALQPYLQIL
jgi:hypothetical protein